MKKVNLIGKLTLGKEAISKLNDGSLSNVKGGGPNSKVVTCYTICGISCQAASCNITCIDGVCATQNCDQ
jgi:hypothetical protein